MNYVIIIHRLETLLHSAQYMDFEKHHFKKQSSTTKLCLWKLILSSYCTVRCLVWSLAWLDVCAMCRIGVIVFDLAFIVEREQRISVNHFFMMLRFESLLIFINNMKEPKLRIPCYRYSVFGVRYPVLIHISNMIWMHVSSFVFPFCFPHIVATRSRLTKHSKIAKRIYCSIDWVFQYVIYLNPHAPSPSLNALHFGFKFKRHYNSKSHFSILLNPHDGSERGMMNQYFVRGCVCYLRNTLKVSFE